ncbi:MAG TPA: class I SAM-dependent methyltransferase, partial [Planctomycetaceae bacterium]|nr:class I SAM-dependent methyltransferase [Planctomycetaceae bacterium]
MIQAIEIPLEETNARLQGLVRMPCPLCNHSDSMPENMIAGYQLEKCGGCGFVFMNPRCTPEHLDEIYRVRDEDELVQLYARIASPSVVDGYRHKLDIIEAIVPARGRLLDFACAAGYFFEEAQKRGWDAHGCDIGQWTAKAAQSRGLRQLHVGSLGEIGFEPESFDVIYAAQVFEHLLLPNRDLAELLSLLKPGGMLYIDVPNYRTLPIMFGKDDFMLNEPPQHINYFTSSTMREMLSQAGMTNILISSDGGMKWENLLGRPISSEIASAYGLSDDNRQQTATGPSLLGRCRDSAKAIVKSTVIRPLFYNRLRVGM